MWHQTTVNAYDGTSWAMNDPELGNNGGYLDHWYQTLDSPPVTLPTGVTNTLTFMQNRNVEGTAGASDPYDGWDGTNVRISPNGGADWVVLGDPTPAYNSTSMYSFGFEFNEGPGVPGWGGVSGGWEAVSFTIPTMFDGVEVLIRWAFASDPAYSTPDDPTMFGWLIDDIDIAGVLTNNGDDATGWVAESQVPIAGDLWRIAFVAPLPPPVNLMAEAGDGNVSLSWAPPITGTEVDIIYDNPNAWRYYLNDAQPYAVTFEVADDNSYVTEGYFYMYGNPFDGTFDVEVYSVNGEGAPETLLHTVSDVEVGDAWPVAVDLSSAGLSFNAGESFAIAVGGFLGGEQGILCDSLSVENPATGNSWVWGGDAFYPITEGYDDIANLAIRAEVTVAGGGMIPDSYNVYRRLDGGPLYGDPLASGLTVLTYDDMTVENGSMYYYAVSANYGEFGESDLSADVGALPESQTVIELAYDDGTAENGYTLGNGFYQAVKFTPTDWHTLLKRAKIYVDNGTGSAICYIWDDIGPDGMPPDEYEPYIKRWGWSGLEEGWNTYDLTEDSIFVDGGSIYFGYKEVPSTPGIGADASGYNGHSYYDVGEGWDNMENLLSYNMMLRLDVDTAFIWTGLDELGGITPRDYSLKQNYPNPFNPLTQIDYSLPAAGQVRLAIYDLSGREVDVVVNEYQQPGNYRLSLDGTHMSSGVYIYTLTAGDTRITRKMTLLK
jgi:hypothetical protein